LFSNDSISEKERMIISAQRAYSDFIYQTAWYEFKFMPWIKKVWTASDSTNASGIRKWERTLFFTFEYSFKALYAQLIEWAAKGSYEVPVTNIYLLASSKEPITATQDLKIIKEQGNKRLMGITRWGAFTSTVKTLCNKDIQIHDIAGNDEIVVSIILKKSQPLVFNKMNVLYKSAIVTHPDLTRLVCLVPVTELVPFICYVKSNSIEVEHVFDY
jgi:hypothetical protein